MDLSLIIPCYNEQDSLPAFLEAVTATYDATGLEYELVFIDDGCTDGTNGILTRFARERGARHVRVVTFSRNFGKESGILAGLEHARGDCIGIIDADLQQRPETLLEMYRILREHPEYDSVAACQFDRKQGPVRKLFSSAFYGTFNSVSSTQLIPEASDFRVFRRKVAVAILSLPEYYRFSKGIFAWIGFKTYPFPYTPDKRAAGTSKWSFRQLWNYGKEGMLSFSTLPLRISTWIGAISSVIALVYLVIVIYEWAALHNSFAGYPTIVCLILLFGGLILLTLGILGEYLGRVYVQGKNRPIYIASEVITVDDGEETDEG